MSVNETHHVVLTKNAVRQLRAPIIQKDTIGIIASANNKTMANKGWLVEEMLVGEGGTSWTVEDALSSDYNYVYSMHLAVTYTRTDSKKPEPTDLIAILNTLYSRAGQPSFGRWVLTTVDGEPFIPPGEDDKKADDEVGYVDVALPENWKTYFEHLYGLDPHISRVRASLEAAIESNWANRFHVALMGPPACGKSDIAGSVREALGHDAVWLLDGTAITSAGIIKELDEMTILPRIIVIEEIEKADPKALAFLLGLLDLRGEIRKVTVRGSIRKDTRCLAICTVNNVDMFDSMMAGALSSRFTQRVSFNRPTRETLIMILAREVQKVNGRAEWIAPAVDYCLEHGIDDPRQIIAFCLCGRDDLLDGTYQQMVDATSPKGGDE